MSRSLPFALVLLLAPLACAADVVKPDPAALATAGARFDFAAWDGLLRRYVDEQGRVGYARLRATPADLALLERLYAQVAAQSMEALPSKAAREAFLIDAYNVCVWKGVLARDPAATSIGGSSLAQLSFFVTTRYLVSGRETNLKKLEDEQVRAIFTDPRVHVALNCASAGCPRLPREAFTPERLDEQLDREARRFVAEERNVRWDAATRTVTLSRVFDWYAKDFPGGPIAWINQHLPTDRQLPTDARIRFSEWDWSLNRQP